jgi:hypothetical protein
MLRTLMDPTTTAVTVRLSDAARAGWEDVCLAHGVTLTALVESIGCTFAETGITLLPAAMMVIDRARQIDADRRRRG